MADKEYYELNVKTNCKNNTCVGKIYLVRNNLENKIEISHLKIIPHTIDLNPSPTKKPLESDIKRIDEDSYEESKKENGLWWIDL